MKEKLCSVAIDGPAGAGKSTIAKSAAKRFGFIYVDTGAIYRTVGLAAKRAGIDPHDAKAVIALLPKLSIRFDYGEDGVQHMFLQNEDVSAAIRTPEISMYASAVSAIPEVRAFLMDMQRDMAKMYSVVMDGRDIGTVVLPDAGLKIFLTASAEARAKRRLKELAEKGDPSTFEEVLADMLVRDKNDSTRAAAPLKAAEDAVLVDTTELDLEESIDQICHLIAERFSLPDPMEIVLAKSAGFCFGVDRAVNMTKKALDETHECWSLGELIHNRDVVERLGSQGLRVAEDVNGVPENAQVVIRSHGVPRAEKIALEEKGCRILDATCPRVARIHRIVEKASAEGRQVVIFGEPTHPEVQGICGWCENAAVVSDREEFDHWAKAEGVDVDTPLTVVFQTTSNKKTSEQTINSLKKEYTNSNLFDTICDATNIRQAEARELSSSCDAMVVVGGCHSANSIHLAEICRERCDRVLFVQNAEELDMSQLSGVDRVGITAGASTPSWIIKEVVNKMNEPEILKEETVDEAAPVAEEAAAPVVEEAPVEETPVVEAPVEKAPAAEAPAEKAEMSFDELLEESIKTIYNGDTVTGVVAAIGTTEITLDLPTKHSGYISVSEFTDDKPGVDINDLVKIGDEIQASVIRVNDVEGTVQLSKRRLDAAKSWDDIEASAEEGTVLEGKVSEDNKGGVVINLKGIRVFIPASQTGLGRDVPMSELVGQTVRFKITEVNRARKRVVGSIRQVAARERREKAEKIWSEIEVGKKYNGVVKSMTSYGAFVDIGGVDGMVHVSEISWSRIRKPDDVLSVGDEVEVYVINFDPEKKKISLGYRKPEDNPWTKFTDTYKVGDVANVKIVKFMTFGAFAEIIPGVDGLIHISQIANRRIGKPDEELTVGQQVDAKITAIDNDKQKVSLSIRALLEPAAPARERSERAERSERRQPEPEGDALVYEISADGHATGFAPEEDEVVEE